MSQVNEVFQTLAANPVALQTLIDAFEALLAVETVAANNAARAALFDQRQVASACVCVGRTEMLHELVKKMKSYKR